MGGRREVSIIFYRPVTRSDLKQERSFFRGSVIFATGCSYGAGIVLTRAEGGATDEPDRGKSQRDDVLAKVKGLLAQVVPSQSFGPPQYWACG